jgi:hypothetical protein
VQLKVSPCLTYGVNVSRDTSALGCFLVDEPISSEIEVNM